MASIKNETTALNTGSSLIQNLMSPSAYPHPVAAVRLVETHISWVLLTGDYVYKIKKPVNFGFLDFSTLEQRRHYCHEELRLNRRLAEEWYLGVVKIAGSIEQPQIDGSGDTIEYAVKMRQFPTAMTLKDRTKSGAIGPAEIDRITDLLADFHANIAKTDAESPYGGSNNIKHWFDENYHHIRSRLKNSAQLRQLEAIEYWGEAEWQAKTGLMEQRKKDGFVRECHGDMHLGNMTFIDGNIILFDCIEFNPMLRWIDVISEVAFLMIDLLHFNLGTLAYRFLNRYLQQTGDYQGIRLLRYYLVYRALVLAKVSLLRSEQQHDDAMRAQNFTEYRIYADLAERFTETSRPILLITHGFSGSGKSHYASQLAERISAVQLRSDIERKRLYGFRAEQSSGSRMGGGIYSEDASRKTYERLACLAQTVFEAGFSVIVDATFLKIAQRKQFRQLAVCCGVPFRILDFQAGDQVLIQRILQRQHQDASEATIEVLQRQQQTAEPLRTEDQDDVIAIDSESDQAIAVLLSELA
ncbi:AAA family ATPase [Methylomicrobium sp. Wu6]|uniref:bifunctional aminoglycoside phosphotransferase/ATP-binding protein n=1 Tax=Methylomicrobium sp. Wu6 TaxID=3107928 RepID=UPI002DD622BF|nr:AAA family ATPase [Methylomicrobium sp. Wu6]MEC4749215.1 AAA family ATPase [Methylomicrobium sp. Wu6]